MEITINRKVYIRQKIQNFLLDEEYIPFDFDTNYDDPLYTEYRRVRMLENPFEDTKEVELKQKTKGFGDYDNNKNANSTSFSFSKSWPSSFAQADNNVDYSKYGDDFSKKFLKKDIETDITYIINKYQVQ